MNKINVFCFGFGQVAKNFVKKLKTEKIPFQLTTTSREETKSKNFEDINYQSFHFDEKKFDNNLIKNLKEADHILISIAPVNSDDIVIKNFKEIFKNKKFKWITYLSATSVYGNHDGAWVDEESNTNPTSTNGIERLQAEESWLKLAEKNNLPLQIFRLSGIYSNQYNVLKRLKAGEAKIINKKNHFFSRIHVEDIANVLFKSLDNFKKGEIYNISDDRPSSNAEVIMYGIKLLGIDKPKTIEIDEIKKNEMLENFYKDSKKVSNKKMKIFFRVELKHPTYIEGLNYINNNSI
jgi:hypothetical protein